MPKKKNRRFKIGYRLDDKDRLDTVRIDSQQAVESVRLSHLTNLGKTVNPSKTSQKSYWKMICRVMNECRAPKVTPILVNNLFILNCRENAKHFNDYPDIVQGRWQPTQSQLIQICSVDWTELYDTHNIEHRPELVSH